MDSASSHTYVASMEWPDPIFLSLKWWVRKKKQRHWWSLQPCCCASLDHRKEIASFTVYWQAYPWKRPDNLALTTSCYWTSNRGIWLALKVKNIACTANMLCFYWSKSKCSWLQARLIYPETRLNISRPSIRKNQNCENPELWVSPPQLTPMPSDTLHLSSSCWLCLYKSHYNCWQSQSCTAAWTVNAIRLWLCWS